MKTILVLIFSLVSARSYKETAWELTDNVVDGMIYSAAKAFPKRSFKDKNSAIAAIKVIQNDFPAVCYKVLIDSVAMMAESLESNPKMQKLKTAYKSIKLLELGYLNLTVFAMHPELIKNSKAKIDVTDLMSSLDKRWGKTPKALDRISKVEMEVMQAGLKVLESDDTLDLVIQAL
jgi:hypothetical protein